VRIIQEESDREATESDKSTKGKEMIMKYDNGSGCEQNDPTTSGKDNY
jgi:hypothetical protein